jgi:hypothetical protein
MEKKSISYEQHLGTAKSSVPAGADLSSLDIAGWRLPEQRIHFVGVLFAIIAEDLSRGIVLTGMTSRRTTIVGKL